MIFTVRVGLLYLISGLGGSLMSALFIQSNISVGASGALFGLLGGMLAELITNWTIYANKVSIWPKFSKLYWSFDFFCCLVILTLKWLLNSTCADSCSIDTCDNYCHQLSCGNPPACGQLRSYWRIFVWFSAWFCIFDPSTIWLG